MIIHGGVGGYSRLLVFLDASSNNRKEKVLVGAVRAAVTQHGVPSGIRADHGRENNGLCEVMELLRGSEGQLSKGAVSIKRGQKEHIG